MKTFRARARAWLLPPLSLYWRRRRRPLRTASRTLAAATIGPLPITPLASPMTLVSIQRHYVRPRYTTWLRSRTSAVTCRVRPPADALPRVSWRIVVKRVIEPRPIDGAESLPATLQILSRSPDERRPRASVARRLFTVPNAQRAAHPATGAIGRMPLSPARSSVRNKTLTRTVRLLTKRTRAEVTELTRTMLARADRVADPVRLAWRRPSARIADTAATPAAPSAAASAASASAAPSVGATVPALERSTPSTSRPAAAALAVDAATVDRLADTVIRRIERRVRIERERRGL